MATKKKSALRIWTGRIHLWLGLTSGILVCFLGITGCILAFQQEIEGAVQKYRYTEVSNAALLPPSALKEIADKEVPGKVGHSVAYEPGKSAQVVYYNLEPEYYYIVYINPYSGEVLKVKDMDKDFFRWVIMGHYYLWLPPEIGQPILTSATLIFVFMLITGIILWWPKNRAASKKRFSVKWGARWKRVNYDLHSVFGFYATWILIFTGLTGVIMGFQWFAGSVYYVASGGKEMVMYYESHSDVKNARTASEPPMDVLWSKMRSENPGFQGVLDIHIPTGDSSAIEVAMNPLPGTYWKTDYRYYDQYTFEEMKVDHAYGRYSEAKLADKIMRMNYDIHVGAIGGLPTKILAFFASLIAASLPVTGVMIWIGKRRRTRQAEKEKRNSPGMISRNIQDVIPEPQRI